MTFRIDATKAAAVAVCQAPGCPWREIRSTRDAVLVLAADHDRAVHGSHKAAEALAAARRRRDSAVG